jgi:formylglycine-generating enzyme required for sulfatase activity
MGYLPEGLGAIPSEKGPPPSATLPVHRLSWHEAAVFCNGLSELSGVKTCYRCKGEGRARSCEEKKAFRDSAFYHCPGYRLPTEAEWEYAYRAGTESALYNGPLTSCEERDKRADAIAIYRFTLDGPLATNGLMPIAQKAPNAWGLYDMAGNVAEWVQDGFIHDRRAEEGAGVAAVVVLVDPYQSSDEMQELLARQKVLRGGSIFSPLAELRASHRDHREPDQSSSVWGFRCARTMGEESQ